MSSTVAVVGAGLMGSGIAQVAAVAGHDVVLRDVSDEAVARGLSAISGSLARFAAKDKISRADAAAALARITGTTDLGDIAQADVVVEAVFESLEVKTSVFAEIDAVGTAIVVENVQKPTTQDQFCNAPEVTQQVSSQLGALDTFTINSSSFSGNAGTITATVNITQPLPISVTYTVNYQYAPM